MTPIPSYIEDRIRRKIPLDSSVVPGSTPVVSFGDARSATVATLGLNPSRVEFLDHNGRELVGTSRRLATHRSLGTSDLANAPQSIIAQVLDGCNSYFARNPYRRWFDQFEGILNVCGVSYYDGTACHLDLVQWATDPTWGSLHPAKLRNRLIVADAPFLIDQLSNENIKTLLVNGMGVVRQLQRIINTPLKELEPLVGYSYQSTRLFTGEILGDVNVIAWSTNLQSSFGVTSELRTVIANQITKIVS